MGLDKDFNYCAAMPIYTVPFSFYTGLGMANRYGNFSCLHCTVFSSFRIGVLFTSENGMKRIGLVRSRVNRGPVRYEMKTVSRKHKANPI